MIINIMIGMDKKISSISVNYVCTGILPVSSSMLRLCALVHVWSEAVTLMLYVSPHSRSVNSHVVLVLLHDGAKPPLP